MFFTSLKRDIKGIDSDVREFVGNLGGAGGGEL